MDTRSNVLFSCKAKITRNLIMWSVITHGHAGCFLALFDLSPYLSMSISMLRVYFSNTAGQPKPKLSMTLCFFGLKDQKKYSIYCLLGLTRYKYSHCVQFSSMNQFFLVLWGYAVHFSPHCPAHQEKEGTIFRRKTFSLG